MDAEYSVAEVSWKTHHESLMELRFEVFIGEQGIAAEEEVDPNDPHCRHFIALNNAGIVLGCGRLTPEGQIGRMAVRATLRQSGIGSAILKHILESSRRSGRKDLFLHAQKNAQQFYTKHGFTIDGETFIEAGIPHIGMQYQLA